MHGIHGEHMEAQPPMVLKSDSGEGGVRSYQVSSKVRGKAGYAGDGRMKCAWGCKGVHGADS